MRPFILVLAGVNGAGKSSVAGALLEGQGLPWFNPDSFARALMGRMDIPQEEANARAWEHGRSALEDAVAQRKNFAFETTLGGTTIPALLAQASKSHDVVMLYCGLDSPGLHIDRVALRVAHGGHPIPESKIVERWTTSRVNLMRLLPRLARLQVFDNSASARPGKAIPDPVLVLQVEAGRAVHPEPTDARALMAVPQWARPIVEAALQLDRRHKEVMHNEFLS